MSSADEILIDLKLAEFKLLDLQKSFENLKSQPSPVSSITLQWEDVETHFSSLHSSLLHRLQKTREQNLDKPQKKAIQSLCINMDSKGLRLYLNELVNDDEKGSSLREELFDALQSSPNAVKLVLGAVKRFCKMRDECDELSCVLLLEGLIGLSLEIASEVKEEAVKFAYKWQEKLVDNDDSDEVSIGILGFLLFLAAFDLRKKFKKKELLGFLEYVCTREQGPLLARLLGLVKKMPELIQNLIDKKLHIEAIRYIYEFGLDKEFSPVPLLKYHLDHYKKIAKKIRKKNSYGSEKKATSKEINALRAVIQCITDHNLESVFSAKSLEKRILKLENEKGSALDRENEKSRKKRTAQTPTLIHSPIVSHASDPSLSTTTAIERNAQSENMNLFGAPIAPSGAFSTIHSTHPHYWQSPGFYPDNSAMNFSGGAFIPPHLMNLLAGQYGFATPGSYSSVPVSYYPGLVHAPASELQSQHLSGNKRSRPLESAENSKNDISCEITTIPSEQKSSQPNSSSQNFSAQYLGGFPSMNQPHHPGSYYGLPPVSYYPRDALPNAPADSEAQPQQSESTKNAQTSSEQEMPHPNASFYNNHGLRNYTGHYSLGGFPPMNQHTSSFAQLQQLSGDQLPRTLESTKSAQTTPQSNATLYTNQGSQVYTGQYSLGGIPPMTTQTGSYSGVPASHYPRDALNSKQFKTPVTLNQGGNSEA